MPNYAIFIEPDSKFNLEVVSEKKKLEDHFGTQAYLSHPPHSTLYFSELTESGIWLKSLEELLKNYCKSPLEIFIQGKLVFRKDVLAGGGDTIVYSMLLTESLSKLQVCIGEFFKEFSLSKLRKHSFTGKLAKSYEMYGFPFIGEHWLPHFTVASIKSRHSEEYIRSFLSRKIEYKYELYVVSVWEIDGDIHKKISEIRIVD